VAYQGQSVNVPDDTVAVIGADTNATVRVARPGISRRHAIAKYDGSHWVVQDASSRNGTYHDGARIQVLDVTGPTEIRLGHPTEGELIELTPAAAKTASTTPASRVPATETTSPSSATSSPASAASPARPAALPSQATRTRVSPSAAPTAATAPAAAEDPRLDDLVRALNDTVHSIKGLTWSVWAMIAVTAILALLTLFVGIVAR
jgi:pSer/pThr/pTyr-binding forkhead associated (FHA) protein